MTYSDLVKRKTFVRRGVNRKSISKQIYRFGSQTKLDKEYPVVLFTLLATCFQAFSFIRLSLYAALERSHKHLHSRTASANFSESINKFKWSANNEEKMTHSDWLDVGDVPSVDAEIEI